MGDTPNSEQKQEATTNQADNAQNQAVDPGYVEKLKTQAMEANRKLKEYEAQLKATRENELKQKEEWQKYAQLKEQEATEFKSKYETMRENMLVEKKYSALKNEVVKMGIRQEAMQDLDLVDLSDIQIESTSTGRLNVLGADKYAERLKATRPHWFGGQAPNVNTSSVGVTGADKIDAKKILEAEKTGRKTGDMSEYKRLIQLFRTQQK